MRLTKRMNAIVGYVRPDSTVFDICCDHGLMGLLALAQRNDSEVVFVDQSERALAAVRESLKDLDPSLAARAKVLCTAAETIVVPESPSDFIIAGVGTHTVISIIDHLFSKDLSTHRLILAPQQKSQPLRRYLQKKGWGLVDEHVVVERGRFREIIVIENSGDVIDFYGERFRSRTDPDSQAFAKHLQDYYKKRG